MMGKKAKKVIRKALEKMGIVEPKRKVKHKFSDSIYTPRWRYKNYFAVREFGSSHKRWFIEQRYLWSIGQFPDLDNPRLFNEKIHWLNLNYQDSRITRCCDKLEMKEYIKEQVGDGFSVPTIRTYDLANDICFDELPEKFVLKVNWGDGPEYSVLVTDKSKANEDRIKGKMNNAMRPWNNLYYSHFFWGYKNVLPKIYAEEFVESGEGGLSDYKIHCFGGEPKVVLVCEDRKAGGLKKTFFDMDWNLLPCHRADGALNPDASKPPLFDEMVRIARILSAPFPFVRVDFYSVEGKIYVGEMTFHPGCGFEKFSPSEWDLKFGDMIELPERSIIDED